MGAPGWDDAPLVEVPRAKSPKSITIVWPYYENPVWLERQLRYLKGLPARLRQNLSLIVSDDGSPMNPAENTVRLVGDLGLPIRLFRIDVDVRWNWLAARNVAMKHCETWALCTDIDHVPPPDTLEALVSGAHQEEVIYRFGRVEHNGTVLHPHPNSFFITPEVFWKVGGYDENLSGCYGTDGDWRRRCAKQFAIGTLKEVLVRHEHQLDSSTTRYKRKQPEDARKKGIMRATRHKGWRPKVLSFPWHEVAL